MGDRSKRRRKITQTARVVADSVPPRSGVLIVENDPDLQWSLARLLTVRGHRVVGTSSGEGAIALVEQWPVSLVLVDEDLPGMDGLELAKQLGERHPEIPVILMTGDETPDVAMAARLVGAVGTLTKPFQLETVVEMLDGLAQALRVPTPAE